ncbi:MAG: UDP-N-acetylmuramoyl-L-alanine--D-glutamate ligase [Acetobacteraceae bacterium]|nr:UDP-N-acetylmuramoyl-L-alanine--D-glutamate ligase [Acetobacteraceae bacterium]
MNFPTDLFAGLRFAVVGLGKNGLPVARRLVAMGALVTAWDDSAAARAAAIGLDVRMPEMARLDALVLSPGIPHRLPRPHPIAAMAIAAGVPILSDVELLYRAVRRAGSQSRFVGVTGTNGKSTTTALLAHIIAGTGRPMAAGGNLGVAALDLPLLGDDGIYVIEMSSYMLERLATLRFNAAVMLNLSPDHLDRHGDMAGYARAKRSIFDRQTDGDLAVVGIEDDLSRAMAAELQAVTIAGQRRADFWADGTLLQDKTGVIVDLAQARALPGAHNAQNAAAASAMALHLGLSRAEIAAGIISYPGLPHRQEDVGSIAGVRFINDSKATNADSTARAMVCYDRFILFAGGQAKDGGILPLATYFPRIALALLIGRDARILAATLAEPGVPHRCVDTLAEATEQAWQAARDGVAPVVLLSPACASWDQFTGYDQRGDMFRDQVAAIKLREGV